MKHVNKLTIYIERQRVSTKINHIYVNFSNILYNSESKKKHLYPVWQISWAKQEIRSGEDRAEALVSVSTDGRIAKWTLCSSGLDCNGTLVWL